MKNRDSLVLYNIITYCKKINANIERFGDSFEIFLKDDAYQDILSFCIEHIGESVNLFSGEFVKENKEQIPFKKIKSLRNRIAHDYISVNFKTIWRIVKNEIPLLETFCTKKIKEIESQSQNPNDDDPSSSRYRP
jgi:uncharacterized protein with HEPN domain